MKLTIGIDLGGTRIKGIVIDSGGTIVQQVYRPTDDGDGALWKHVVAAAVEELTAHCKGEPEAIGISAPGLPSADHSSIRHMPGRMQGLENFVWQEFLKKPAYVVNDAVAALVAESAFGVARGRKHVVMLTLGTGVGGAILVDGKPYFGAFGKAGHIGHMVVNDEQECDVTGIPGSLEDCIGNCTIGKRSKGRFASTHELLNAHRSGDEFATAVWLKSVKQLAIALASITNILSPELIVIGGGISEAGDVLFKPLDEYMAEFEWRAGGNRVEIVKARQGDLAGSIGAAYFASRNGYKEIN